MRTAHSKINQDYGRNVESISERAMEQLMLYDWPGNVRELENVLGRAMIFLHHTETEIDLLHLPELKNKQIKEISKPRAAHQQLFEGTLNEQLEQYEEKLSSTRFLNSMAIRHKLQKLSEFPFETCITNWRSMVLKIIACNKFHGEKKLQE